MYYHISTNDYNSDSSQSLAIGDSKIFKPRIPHGFIDESGKLIEDSVTPRVCLAPTILGCILASDFASCSDNLTPDFMKNILNYVHNITVFATEKIPNIFVPKQIRSKQKVPLNYEGIVPDRDLTKEVWSLDTINLTVIYRFDWSNASSHILKHKNMMLSIWKNDYNNYMPKKFFLG